MIEINGVVAPGFERVRETFAAGFLERGDLGSAFALWRDDEWKVDLWGGVVDGTTGRPWSRDTLQLIFSGSKGIAAVALLVLVDRGALDLDRPVAYYWPEFAAQGKGGIAVSEAVTFRAGLPGLQHPVTQDEIEDPVAMAALIAAQRPEAAPGLMYGPFTQGWIVSELIRRVAGVDLRTFFRSAIAEPHALDIHFGVGEDDLHRVARTEYGPGFIEQFASYYDSADRLTRRVWQNPRPFPPDERIWSAPGRLTALVPAINVAGTARDIARLYGMLAEDAARDLGAESRVVSRRALDAALVRGLTLTDPVMGIPMTYSAGGFRLRNALRDGASGLSFGHDGGGGSAHQAWPRVGAGISFVMNRLIALGPEDKRAAALISAASDCLDPRLQAASAP